MCDNVRMTIGILFLTSALAAPTNAPTELPAILVEASRVNAAARDMPSAVRVIDDRAIADAAAHELTDLLSKEAPELHLRHVGGGNPALAEIAMRGYGEGGHGRTLVLVDGERLNSPDLNAPNLARVALGAVDRVEVLAGPQTVLHGDGASAGVINIVTEPRSYEKKTYVDVHGGSWGSVGASLGTRGGFADEGVRYWADGSWDRSDGYRESSGYQLWNANGGVRKDWESGTYLRVSGFYSDARYDTPGYLSYDAMKRDLRQAVNHNDWYRRSTYGFNATFNAQLNDENALKATGTFSTRTMDAHQEGVASGWPWSFDNHYDIWSCRTDLQWQNTTDLLGHENEFVLGLLYACDVLDGDQDSSGAKTRLENNRQLAEFFVQETFSFTDWLALQLGGRYARAWAYNRLCARPHRNDHLGAGEAALVLHPVEELKTYLKVTRFYRSPFLDEYPCDMYYVPTALLEPECGWNAEVGFDWRPDEELSLGGDVYGSRLENEIFYNPGVNNVNSDDPTWRAGVDLRAAWEREKTAGVSLGASWVKATFAGGDYGGNAIPLVPEFTLTVNGRVWLWDEAYVLGGYRFQSDMVTLSDYANAGDNVGWYGLFHVGVVYRPAFADWIRGVSFSIMVDNLLDETYCDYASYGRNYWPAQGRTFTFAVRYQF